jgi:hypothetical protein
MRKSENDRSRLLADDKTPDVPGATLKKVKI